MKLELRNITKKFGDFAANEDISLIVNPGEIVALLGENGAGKSTLMNVVYGLLQPTSGEIFVNDVQEDFEGPGDAMTAGIGMVHQHFMLVPPFTVAENVMLGHEHTKGAFLDLDAARSEVRRVSEAYNLQVDPDALVEDLPVGVQQRVEIIKALVRDAGVLILDEPTAVLTPQETDELLGIMRDLKAKGTSIVFISHKLREVQAAADRIVVIRRGRVVGEASPEATKAELAGMMVGREVSLTVEKPPGNPGEPVLQVSDLSAADLEGRPILRDLNFEVRAGEILGVAGVQGNGQTELAEVLTGLYEGEVTGSITMDGKELTGRTPREILDGGLGYVPEDREHDGLISSFTVTENLVLDQFGNAPYSSGGVLKSAVIDKRADELIEEFDVRTQGAAAPVSSLSGGNKQKVVMAREMSRELRVLVASQPTRGVDVGSIEFLHKRIVSERERGAAVLIISSELDEIYALSDRIAVMYRGAIIGVVGPDTSRDEMGLLMAGVTND
ncbi:MAG: ABC transporter ATP-binding protein [Actinobacteria bacterium]|nr:ABC transporter ATP-binding protein [Actinomycetota bacterium]MCB8997459.1 ABC transporter ATP-binding protein [Actinomycetota bacterium]